MKRKVIHRTATFAWSPTPALPLIATGTVAGALDESFSNESQLEIWAPDFLNTQEYDLGGPTHPGPKAYITDGARFNRLAWTTGREQGVIAAGLENGELALWDPAKILAHEADALILRNSTHTGPIRGLDFNKNQKNLLSSGAVNGEVYVWDLKDPSKPYSPTPGTRSTKLDEITAVAWNSHVPSVLAGASSTGYTVVWDLRGKKEVVALAYGGGAGTMMTNVGIGNGMAMGGRRGMSDIAWHPDNATRLVTASEDDSSPIIMLWDLRNARAPEKILTGHEKGVLSLSWCAQDPDLLLSCGKDNRALCWNPQPQTPEVIGELPAAENWAFQVDWCPGNPDLLATAFFDGTIGIHSIQATNTDSATAATPAVPSDDIFASVPASRGTFSLTQPPKWLRRPASANFGFGGKLVTVSNLPSAQGKHQSAVVHTRTVISDSPIIQRVEALRGDRDALCAFAESKDGDVWKALAGLFGKDHSADSANSREELIALLGFSKEEVAAKVAEAIANVKNAAESTPGPTSEEVEQDIVPDSAVSGGKPVVSFLEPEPEPEESEQEAESAQSEKTPSEVSVSVTSHIAGVDGESTTTAPSLFGEDNAGAAANDFFATIGTAPAETVPHTSYPLDSSVAATIGSGASSAGSDSTHEGVTFRIYATDESDTDRLITQALVLGDFESAVSLCLSVDRFTDAILLAGRGGPALLARTQKAYFSKMAGDTPYLRLFQSVVDADLADVVRHADLREWREVFVVICTFAKEADFASLAEMLGRRLEQASRAKVDGGKQIRRDAETTYLAAAKLERLVDIWAEELQEEEQELLATLEGHQNAGIKYEAYSTALQTFMEKVAVFRAAVNYVDSDLVAQKAETYKLVSLYERYIEYADILAAHGLLEDAVKILALVPQAYDSKLGSDARDRVLLATGKVKSSAKAAPAPATTTSVPAYGPSYLPPAVSLTAPRVPAAVPPIPNAYPYSIASNVPAPPHGVQATAPSAVNPPPNPYAPPVPTPSQPFSTPYQPVAPPPVPFRAPGQSYTPSQINAPLPPPPARAPPPPSVPIKRDQGGWNDVPVTISRQRTPNTANANKPAAIVSPFPNSMPGSPTPSQTGQSGILPPPPRPGSAQARPPPPPQASRMSVPPPPPGSYAPPPQHALPPGPPSRNMSPAINQGYAPPPPPQANPGPYGPPPPVQRDAGLPPPPATGPYAPPPGAAPRGGPPPPPPAAGQSPLAPPPAGPPTSAPAPPPARRGPAPPKYPPGDRTHIPESSMLIFSVISGHLNELKESVPPQQRRLVDDLERRINPLFDALNCETLSQPIIDQLLALARAMAAHDRESALAIHINLLTTGSRTDDIGMWMSGVKQLIMRLPPSPQMH